MTSRCLAFMIAAVMLLCIPLLAEEKAEKAAVESADRFLALVDAGDYAASWEQTAEMFKNAVSKEQWVKMLTATRTPLGNEQSRKLKSATYQTSLPGAPDGQYVVVQYNSSFEHKKSAVETVTPMLEKDGKWRVSGYYIR